MALAAAAVLALAAPWTVGADSGEPVAGRSMSVALAPGAPSQYVVQPGDTLWDISRKFLRDPWYWPEIWYVNPAIRNPHLIYPGDVLQLVYVDGKPRVTLERGSATRLSPQVRSSALDDAVRAVPYDVLMDFVGRPQLLSEADARKAPYVVGIRDRHLIGSTENEVYARKLGQPPVDSRYTVVHVGEELRDPDDGDLLGYMGHYAATTQVIQAAGSKAGDKDPITHLRVVESGREILQGDKLFPAQVDLGDDLTISAPANSDLDGQVIAVVDGVYVAGRYQVLAINRGRRDGLAPGHAIAIFERGGLVRDRYDYDARWRQYTTNYETLRLPRERSGTVLLFRVYERMSYGLVVEATHAMRIGDYVKHPDFGHRDSGLDQYRR